MAPLRIGIAPLTNETGGGAYQYGQTMLSVLAELRGGREEEFVVLADGLRPGDPLLGGEEWEIAPLAPGYFRRRAVAAAKRRLLPRRDEAHPTDGPRRRHDVRAHLERLGVDLVVYPYTTALAFEAGTSYVLAVHDLMHRRHAEFPEFGGSELAWREYMFGNGIREASVVLVDSEIGKKDVLELYGEAIEPERVAVLPFLPGTPTTVTDEDRARVRRTHRLPERYLFYPAQFWPHKNHRLIVEAMAELEDVDLVLVGSARGAVRERNHSELFARARELGVDRRIHHLGYVPAEDVAALYAEAVALVMPTFFGPTNIPVLEAWALDCPVITSDIRGVREQAGDAALLIDPDSAESLAAAIRRVWLDEELRADLVQRGRERLGLYSRADYAQRLGLVLDHAGTLVRESKEPVGV
ncbi:MAG: glycosyltransferase family 4 protein [Gaiellaceae bacterium]